MTLQKAERISGYEIRKIPMGRVGTARTYAAFDQETGAEVLRITMSGDARTISALVEALYRRTATRVMGEQGYRCFSSGRIVPLQIDHIKKRSAGRDDRRFNLRALGAEEHERRHREPLRPVKPHPEVLRRMRELGWEWGSEETGWIETDSKTSLSTKPSSSLTSLRTVSEERSGGSA